MPKQKTEKKSALEHSKPKEITFRGIPASPGIAIGRVHFLRTDSSEVMPRKIAPSEVEPEIERLERAIKETRAAMTESRERAIAMAGETIGRIFDAHLLILEDEEFQKEVRNRILREQFGTEFIVYDTLGRTIELMEKQKGELFRERAADVRDVRAQLLRFLQGNEKSALKDPDEPSVLVASGLSPTDTLHIDKERIQGIAIDLGGATSHTAILARSLEIPAVVGLGNFSSKAKEGQTIILNGNSGKVLLAPTTASLKEYRAKRKRYQQFQSELVGLRELPSMTKDGHTVELHGNIELPHEVESVLSHGGSGVGLFRSEYIFLTRGTPPNEEEQFEAYKKAAEALWPHPITIRTFDLGGDKLHSGLHTQAERNPFLGWRAIRVSLSLPDLFRTQLRAILRASAKKNVRIMFPLIASLWEVRKVKQALTSVKEELRREGIPFDEGIPIGIMVEVPSAVILADILAKEVDFFSIGTNDLIMYTLAVDRGNEMVSDYYRAHHPAVLRLIRDTVHRGHDAGIPVGICGEIAGDPLSTVLLIGLGVDELSVSPAEIPEIKKIIRSINSEDCKAVAEKALELTTAADVSRLLEKEMKARFADLPIWFTSER
ncbi:phosphoenolpyruvate--protein phosphotransferase [bacterium]|nr:phosphoenolpyruvate--protein phosphotransferase [bacterium]